MPHLQFDLNFTPKAEEKRRFAELMIRRFGLIMQTGTAHVAVTLRCLAPEDLVFGRANGGRALLLSAHVRKGRTPEQKREFTLACVEEANRVLGVAPEAVYVVYTEHDGPDFQLSDRVLPQWSPGEDPLANGARG